MGKRYGLGVSTEANACEINIKEMIHLHSYNRRNANRATLSTIFKLKYGRIAHSIGRM